MRQHDLKALREAIGRALRTEGEPLRRSRCPSGAAGTRAIRLAFALAPSDRPAAAVRAPALRNGDLPSQNDSDAGAFPDARLAK